MFQPRVSPEHMPDLPEAAAVSHISPDPFQWEPQPAMQYDFEMQDGVIRVWSDKERRQEPFPVPGNSYDFFSDMSRWDTHASRDEEQEPGIIQQPAAILGTPLPPPSAHAGNRC